MLFKINIELQFIYTNILCSYTVTLLWKATTFCEVGGHQN